LIPVHVGTDSQFALVRDVLIQSGYTEPELCRRLGINTLSEYERDTSREQYEPYEESAAGVLVRLFVDGRYAEVRIAEERLGAEALQAMSDLGLVLRNEDDLDLLLSPVSLYPTHELYIVSDRWNTPDRSPYMPVPDIVYPAIVSNAQRFVDLMPRRPCENLLDLCAGTGIAAMIGAREFAGRAWSADITERSTIYAQFNCRLNGVANVTPVQGDLYAPLDGMLFDAIVAHPPYVPVLRPKFVYHDGGQDGEQLMRRIVNQLPEYLRPGGLFYMLATGHDRQGEPLENRVRGWLGEAQSEFDVALVVVNTMAPEEFAAMAAVKSRTPQADLEEFKRLFHELGVVSMVYSVILIQRRREAGNAFTVRRNQGLSAGRGEIEWLLDWETLASSPGGRERILAARVRANPESELHVVHKLEPSGWDVTEHVLRAAAPFSMEARTEPWAPYMMAFCDGSRTVQQHLEELKAHEIIPAGTTPDEFARAVGVLISGGFLLKEN
jgi:methylase of polypeptide subunit release factors